MDTNITTSYKFILPSQQPSLGFSSLSSWHGVFHRQTMCFYCFPSNSWQSIYLLKTKQFSNIFTSHMLAYVFMLSSKKTWPLVTRNESLGYTQVPDHQCPTVLTPSSLLPWFLVLVVQSKTEMKGCEVLFPPSKSNAHQQKFSTTFPADKYCWQFSMERAIHDSFYRLRVRLTQLSPFEIRPLFHYWQAWTCLFIVQTSQDLLL